MAAALQTRTVEARGDTVMAELTAVEATRARDALCRALYNRLFTWIVNRANEAIKVRLELRGPSGSGGLPLAASLSPSTVRYFLRSMLQCGWDVVGFIIWRGC